MNKTESCNCQDYCMCKGTYPEVHSSSKLAHADPYPRFDLERLQMRLECLKLASMFTDPDGDGVYAIELANRYYDYLTK